MGTKITASEQRFRLRGCPGDDTIFFDVWAYHLRMVYLGRFLVVQGPAFSVGTISATLPEWLKGAGFAPFKTSIRLMFRLPLD